MPNIFLDTKIPFTQQNHCSVFFAHLQNILRKSYNTSISNLELDKICHVVNDIYLEHQKLETSYEQMANSTKNMMVQFTDMLNQCKGDREQVMRVSQDRLDLLAKLKQSNDYAMQLSAQNQILKQTVQKLKQINQLMVQKSKVTEQQLQNRKLAQVGYQSFSRISAEYDRLLQSNSQIRGELLKICNQSQAIQKISKSMQIINKAIKMQPKIKKQMWDTVHSNKETNGANTAKEIEEERKFCQFDFDWFFQEIRKGNR